MSAPADEPDDLLGLDPGERVLWQGRAAVGAAWPSFGWLAVAQGAFVLLVLAAWSGLASVAALGALGASALGAAWALSVGGCGLLVVIALSKVVGPSYFLIVWILVAAPAFGLPWLEEVSRQGWAGAVARTDGASVALALGFLALPIGLLALDVIERLGTSYVFTDQRVVAVCSNRKAPVWQRRLGLGDVLKLERSWREPGGCLVIGPRRLRLRDDDPERVLELVRSAREERAQERRRDA